MKANFRKLKSPIEQAFHIRKESRTNFYDNWHFHEMLEFVVILKGKGKRYIGDSIETFSKGDVILVGEKLPHVWRSELTLDKPKKNTNCESIIIQFQADFLSDKFLNLPESQLLLKLFENAKMGISFSNETSKILLKKINSLIDMEGMNRLINFLDILNIASKSKDYKLLASPLYKETILKGDVKINKVFEYVMDNFTSSISLEKAALLSSMNKTAFCRYFKQKTKKTFTQFLNEIRIGHACKLIREEQYLISEAAYLSGYNSLSHFNNQFHIIKNESPTNFYLHSKNL